MTTQKLAVKVDERSESQARSQFESIKDMVTHLKHTQVCQDAGCNLPDADIYAGLGLYYKKHHPTHGRKATEQMREEYHNRENTEQHIHEDPLSVEVRSDWHTPGSESREGEYRILLCTGGPACRIVGQLSQYSEPETARIEHQDWGTPWTEYRLDSDEEKIVLTYAQQFYFSN